MKKILFFALMLLCSTTVMGQVLPSVSTVEQLKAEIERNNSWNGLLILKVESENHSFIAKGKIRLK